MDDSTDQAATDRSRQDPEQVAAVAIAFIEAYFSKMDQEVAEKTSVLIYFSQEEVDAIAAGLLADWDEAVAAATAKKPATFPGLVKALEKETKDRTSAPDIALFGRMLAEKPT